MTNTTLQQPSTHNGQLPPEIINWLTTVLAPEYSDINRTQNDTIDVLISYPSLRPKTNVYTDEYGRPDLLLCIYGTIPATIGSSTYRIPVEVWIPKGYPQNPPFSFVRPTPDMRIHPGNYVDTNGRCYHPYIANWHENRQNASLKEMLSLLSVAFGKEPPVYAKPPEYQAHLQAQTQSQTPPPLQPDTHPSKFVNPTQKPPPLPPHPNGPSLGQSHSQVHVAALSTPSNQSSLSPAHTGPPIPPLPPQLTGQNTGPSSRTHSPNVSVHLSSATPGTPGPQMQYGQGPIPPHVQQQPLGPQLSGNRQVNPAYGQALRSRPLDIMDMPEHSKSSTVSNHEMHAPSSNVPVSSPPKLPPNPQKLAAIQSIQNALAHIAQNELQPMVSHNDVRLLQTHETLNWMSRSVRTEMVELDRIVQASHENEKILTEKIQQAQALIQSLQERTAPNIDEIVVAENVVYNQLYDLVAETNAIEDTMYILSKALDKGRISLDAFLKHIRILAREQFMKKALVEKIAKLLSLDATAYY